jgi:hypothetical protein
VFVEIKPLGKKPTVTPVSTSNKFDTLEKTVDPEDLVPETDESTRGIKRKLQNEGSADTDGAQAVKKDAENDGIYNKTIFIFK